METDPQIRLSELQKYFKTCEKPDESGEIMGWIVEYRDTAHKVLFEQKNEKKKKKH